MEKLPESEQPQWVSEIPGQSYYGIEVTDAYLATDTQRGKNNPVLALETTHKHHSRGYWYYTPHHDRGDTTGWYWSVGGGPPAVVKQVFEDYQEKISTLEDEYK